MQTITLGVTGVLVRALGRPVAAIGANSRRINTTKLGVAHSPIVGEAQAWVVALYRFPHTRLVCLAFEINRTKFVNGTVGALIRRIRTSAVTTVTTAPRPTNASRTRTAWARATRAPILPHAEPTRTLHATVRENATIR